MPRIDAPTVAEHVSRREAEILGAATRLFAEQGLIETSMGQIADAVGITRSAVYRYFANKEDILIAAFERRIPAIAAAAEQATETATTAAGKLEAWLAFQVEFAVDPAHEVGRRLQMELHRLPTDSQEAIASGHAKLVAPLDQLVVATLTESGDHRSPDLVAALVRGLLNATVLWAMGHDDGTTARESLLDATRRLMSPSP